MFPDQRDRTNKNLLFVTRFQDRKLHLQSTNTCHIAKQPSQPITRKTGALKSNPKIIVPIDFYRACGASISRLADVCKSTVIRFNSSLPRCWGSYGRCIGGQTIHLTLKEDEGIEIFDRQFRLKISI
uniref:Uncharacterized protein n=1 Tax=Onchocerca volvulus TaxID=6282 RepID=A0A8R1TUF4_ONCVO